MRLPPPVNIWDQVGNFDVVIKNQTDKGLAYRIFSRLIVSDRYITEARQDDEQWIDVRGGYLIFECGIKMFVKQSCVITFYIDEESKKIKTEKRIKNVKKYSRDG